ncbi:hypothetical protein MMC11_001488 [Xylographa trunciseda]|nr:hypothetical protein [Xylographa trunciseda]
MALVGYSDSEESCEESKPTQKPPSKAGASTKLAFQKVIDRSNPHKIKVTLPEASKPDPPEAHSEDEPPAKRTKLGGGGFSGFNSMLPAPKRAAGVSGGIGAGVRRGALGSGVNLKTGATPGFSRESIPAPEALDVEELNEHNYDDEYSPPDTQGISASPGSSEVASNILLPSEEPKPKKMGNPMMFKPLSVARKPQKKKKSTTSVQVVSSVRDPEPPAPPKAVPKISLFSMGTTEKEEISSLAASGDYEPLLYQPPSTRQDDDSLNNTNTEPGNVNMSDTYVLDTTFTGPTGLGSQSLSAVASDLNLSASAKRQLFGRQRSNGKGEASAINVMNFNTDQEYAANELLRQAGEQVQHNPVRALAAGKHSLKQLINAASTQKDALEEHFASGRRNKKEAGSKYGW